MKIQLQIQIQIQVELQIYFGQLLTDEHHRVGQFGPARLGRLMCGTFKFIFVADARFGEEKFEAEQKRRKYRFVENLF